MTTAVDTAPADASSAPATTSAERLRLFIQPALVLLVGAAAVFWAFNRDLTATQRENINPANVAALIWQHLLITAAVTAIVLVIGIPLGVLVTRPGAKLLLSLIHI